jgi:Tol biopolymer transport system component
MSLAAGTRLGAYEVLSLLGAGGMGEVYRASDTRLGRDVALKILPAAFSSDPERLARFEREARTLAALNHPHIAQIYGVEESGATQALVMELVEGPTLADRIAQGALPADEALAIATQLVEALESAHDQGVVHRDLKPANIKVRPDGTVKVLDFGLAKLSDSGTAPVSGSQSMSPTISSPAMMTGVGTLLGTAAYMSPEQAKGRQADQLSDIWAFGVVLLEMLTGRRAYEGEDVAETLAQVLTKAPPLDALPPTTPPAVRRLLRRCLERHPANRLRHIADARFDLADAATDKETPAAAVSPEAARAVARRVTARHAAVAAGAAAIAATVSVAATVYLRRAPAPPPEVQFEIPAVGTSAFMSMSPDGRMVAYTSQGATGPRLWVRALDTLEASVLPGTEGANIPDWSPDSRQIVFSAADQKLKKIDVNGGRPQNLTTLVQGNYQRGTWNRDGVIVFSNAGRLFRVSDDGGEAVEIAKPDAALEETFLATPWFLPDGRRFVYSAWSTNPDKRFVYVGSLDSSERVRLMPSQGKVQYVASGHVVYMRDGTLVARPFDPAALQFRGDPVPLVDQVNYYSVNGLASFHVSDSGSLIFRKATTQVDAGATRQLVWFDRSGKRSDPIGPAVNTVNLSLSPDGLRVASHEGTDPALSPPDVWVYEIPRNVRSRLTTDPANESFAVWSPDGTEIAYMANRNGNGLFKKSASGAGAEQALLSIDPGVTMNPRDWSSAAGAIIFDRGTESNIVSQRDLWVLPATPNGKAAAYLATSFDERQGAFSPNGNYVAYTSNESGMYQVFVRTYPDPSSGRWQISTGGGRSPRWRRDGKELLFVGGDNRMYSVAVVTDSAFKVGAATSLFSTPLAGVASNARPWDIAPDGQRFLMSVPLAAQTTQTAGDPIDPITVVLNWTSRMGRK